MVDEDLKLKGKSLLACIVVCAVCVSAIYALGFTDTFKKPGVIIEEPISELPEGASAITYESLSPEHQTVFRKSTTGNGVVTDNFPETDYIKLDGKYYPVTNTNVYPSILNPFIPFLLIVPIVTGGLTGGLVLINLTELFTLLSQSYPRLKFPKELLDRYVSTVGIGVAVVTIMLLSISVTAAIAAHGYTTYEISEQPVAAENVSNEHVVHLNKLPDDEQEKIQSIIKGGVERPPSELTYEYLYVLDGFASNVDSPSVLILNAKYVRTDGELYVAKKIQKTFDPSILFLGFFINLLLLLTVLMAFAEWYK